MSSSYNENKKREELLKKTLDDFMEQYKREDTPENERVISYEMCGYSVDYNEPEILKDTLSFRVEPYSKESTLWNHNQQSINNGVYYLFVKYKKVNEEYELERMSMIPEYYEEFMAKFEKYQENLLEEKVEIDALQAETQENYLAYEEIETMSNGIKIGSIVLLLLAISIVVQVIRKRK